MPIPTKNSAGPYRHAHPQRSLRTAGAAGQLLETARLAGGRQSGLGAGRCRGLLSNAFHRHGGGRLFHARCPGSPRASRTRCAHHATRSAPAASHHAGPACGVRTRSTAVASSDRQRHSGPIAHLGNNAYPGASGSSRAGSCSCSRCSTTTRRLHPSCRSAPGAGRRQGRAPKTPIAAPSQGQGIRSRHPGSTARHRRLRQHRPTPASSRHCAGLLHQRWSFCRRSQCPQGPGAVAQRGPACLSAGNTGGQKAPTKSAGGTLQRPR